MKENICMDCLPDTGIQKYFGKKMKLSNQCSYCRSVGTYELEAVFEYMKKCIESEWEEPGNSVPWPTEQNGLIDIIDVCTGYELVNEFLDFNNISNNVHIEIFLNDFIDYIGVDSSWTSIDGLNLSTSDSMMFSWTNYVQTVKYECRFLVNEYLSIQSKDQSNLDYVTSQNILELFINAIQNSDLIEKLPRGSEFWRARTTKEDIKNVLLEMSPPPPELATSGRMNPIGIPVFYGATTKELCRLELTGSLGMNQDRISYVKFKTLMDLNIVDFSSLKNIPSLFDNEFSHQRNEIAFMREFIQEAAKSIKKDGTEHIEYIPTQIIAEYLRYISKSPKIHGIKYKSSFSDIDSCIVIFCNAENCTAQTIQIENNKFTDRLSRKGRWPHSSS